MWVSPFFCSWEVPRAARPRAGAARGGGHLLLTARATERSLPLKAFRGHVPLTKPGILFLVDGHAFYARASEGPREPSKFPESLWIMFVRPQLPSSRLLELSGSRCSRTMRTLSIEFLSRKGFPGSLFRGYTPSIDSFVQVLFNLNKSNQILYCLWANHDITTHESI